VNFAALLFACALSLAMSSLGRGHKPDQHTAKDANNPLWKLDLRSVGFTKFVPKGEQWGLHFKPNSLCFSDRSVLIATFITREDATTLARRDQPGEILPLRLHGIFLDAKVGSVRNTREWSITRPRGGIVAVDGGDFAVLSPATIALYSRDLSLLKELSLTAEQQSKLWDFHSSPTGKTILAEYHYPEAAFQWIDLNSLQAQPIWHDDTLASISISDNALASTWAPYIKSKGVTIHEVLIRGRDGAERIFCRDVAGEEAGCALPQFLSNDLLALWGPHGFSVVAVVGRDSVPILTESFRDEWLGHPIFPSVDGKRFAVALLAYKGGSEILDIDPHVVLKRIVVYDVQNRQAVYTFDAKIQKIKDVAGVALSPDGSQLAILSDGVLEVFRLPSERTDSIGP
jgi:hypothetical protein